MDSELKNSEGEVDLERKEEAIQDASFNSKIIERELNNSNKNLDSNRELEMAKFLLDNPDLADVKDELMSYANAHKDLDIEDIKYLVLSKIDPTRLLDEQTKNKLSVLYMDNIVQEDLVIEVRNRLKNINIDAILDSSYVEEINRCIFAYKNT